MKRVMLLVAVALCLLMISQAALAQALSGTYYIPKGTNTQGFTSLNAAFAAVNANGLSANTTFLIDGDLTETDTLVLKRSDLSASKALTIKPNTGKKPTIIIKKGYVVSQISSGAYGLMIFATPYVSIDGSNAVGGTSRDLTILDSLGGANYCSMGLIGRADNVTIKNLNVRTSVN